MPGFASGSVDTVTIGTPHRFVPAVAVSGIVKPGTSVVAVVVTLTGDLLDFLEPSVTNLRAWLIPTIEPRSVLGVLRLGGIELTVVGTQFSVGNLPVGAYRMRTSYYSTARGKTQTWTSAEFTISNSADLDALI